MLGSNQRPLPREVSTAFSCAFFPLRNFSYLSRSCDSGDGSVLPSFVGADEFAFVEDVTFHNLKELVFS
jgi:hypothetical protein